MDDYETGQNKKPLSYFLSIQDFDFGEYTELATTFGQSHMYFNNGLPEKYINHLAETECYKILTSTLVNATKYCQKAKLKPDSYEAYSAFETGSDFVATLFYALKINEIPKDPSDKPTYETQQKYAFRYDTYSRSLIASLQHKSGERKYMRYLRDSITIQDVVISYLDSNCRSDELDKFMFKLLAEEELIQYVDQTINIEVDDMVGSVVANKDEKSKYHTALADEKAALKPMIFDGLKGFFWWSIYAITPLIITLITSANEWFYLASLIWLAVIYVVWLIFFIVLVNQRKQVREYRNSGGKDIVIELVEGMDNLFYMLRDPGKIKLERISQKLNALEEIGAVFPETLHVFIDELKAKGINSL
ncbi:hypothetical protein OAI58_05840 [Amylibacter sp.]|nr:hypothetical protein [Amylibacter sp.]